MYGAHVAKTRETSSDSSTLRTLTHCRPIFERLPNFDQIPFVSQVELIAMPDVVDAEVAEASATILELGRTRRATQAKAAGSTKLAENRDKPSLATQACRRYLSGAHGFAHGAVQDALDAVCEGA